METISQLKRILILDDEPYMLELLNNHLRSCNFETLSTDKWTDAVEQVTYDPPDLILLDLQMPTIQGETVLDFIREECPNLPVIIVSSFLNYEKMQYLRMQGANDFITKPFLLDELVATVVKVLGQSDQPAPFIPEVFSPSLPEDLPENPEIDRPDPSPKNVEHPHRGLQLKNLKPYLGIALTCLLGSFIVLINELLAR